MSIDTRHILARRTVLVNDSGRVIGEDHHRAKLTNAQVHQIHEMRDAGASYKEIAQALVVSKTTVHDVLVCRTRAQTPMGQRVIWKIVRFNEKV